MLKTMNIIHSSDLLVSWPSSSPAGHDDEEEGHFHTTDDDVDNDVNDLFLSWPSATRNNHKVDNNDGQLHHNDSPSKSNSMVDDFPTVVLGATSTNSTSAADTILFSSNFDRNIDNEPSPAPTCTGLLADGNSNRSRSKNPLFFIFRKISSVIANNKKKSERKVVYEYERRVLASSSLTGRTSLAVSEITAESSSIDDVLPGESESNRSNLCDVVVDESQTTHEEESQSFQNMRCRIMNWFKNHCSLPQKRNKRKRTTVLHDDPNCHFTPWPDQQDDDDLHDYQFDDDSHVVLEEDEDVVEEPPGEQQEDDFRNEGDACISEVANGDSLVHVAGRVEQKVVAPTTDHPPDANTSSEDKKMMELSEMHIEKDCSNSVVREDDNDPSNSESSSGTDSNEFHSCYSRLQPIVEEEDDEDREMLSPRKNNSYRYSIL